MANGIIRSFASWVVNALTVGAPGITFPDGSRQVTAFTQVVPAAVPTIVQTAGYTSGASSSGAAVVTFAAPTAGHLLVAFVGFSLNIGRNVVTPTGWTAIDQTPNGVQNADAVATFYKVAAGTETTVTFTVNANGNGNDYCSAVVYELAGTSTATPISGHAVNQVSSATISSPAATPFAANTLALVGVSTDTGSGTSVTPPAGWVMDLAEVPSYHSMFTAHATGTTSTSAAVAAQTFTVNTATGSNYAAATVLVAAASYLAAGPGVQFSDATVQATAFTGHTQVTRYLTAGSFAYTVPPGAVALRFRTVGGTGAPGAGGVVASGTAMSGGAGAGAGAYQEVELSTISLGNPTTLNVIVGSPGAQAAAGAVGTTGVRNGNTGGNGTATTVGIGTTNLIGAPGGNGGAGGASGANSTAGATKTGWITGGGGAPGVSGAAGSQAAQAQLTQGSASGGGISTTPAAFAGGAGQNSFSTGSVTNAVAGATGGNGGNGFAVMGPDYPGTSGAGGGASITVGTAGGNGGNGGPAAPGGGGGSVLSTNTASPGAGGLGSPGFCIITALF